MDTFSTGSSLRFGWETFKRRPWFFIGVTLVILVVSSVVKPSYAPMAYAHSALFEIWGVIGFFLLILLDIGATAYMLHAHDDVSSVKLSDLWHPHQYWSYLATVIILGAGIVVGLLLFIIPGIFLIVLWMFAKYSVVDKNLGPIEALKYSARIGAGHRWNLLLFVIALIVLNIIGAILLLVGLLVTIPVSGLAVVHAYRILSKTASIPVAVDPQKISV